MRELLLAALRDFFLPTPPEKNYWLAYSGGLDSQVLLTLCAELRAAPTFSQIKITAIHINHHLSPHAENWAQHCRRTCAAFDFSYVEENIHLNILPSESLEEVARKKRYEIFAKIMQADDVLLTAHQQDDQAETLLLQLLRGAGPKGLAAMPSIKSFACGLHARPLLNFSRAQLHHYAIEKKLQWIEDESNANIDFTRNFIRHRILAPLKTEWPTVTASIARSAAHCAEAQSLLEEYGVDELKKMSGSKTNTLSVNKLLQVDQKKQKLLLRCWIQQQGFILPNTNKLIAICEYVLLAAQDSQAHVRWQQVSLRRYRDDLYLMPLLPPHDVTQEITWDLSTPLCLSGIGKLQAVLTPPILTNEQDRLRADIHQVTVRFRGGGEKIKLRDRGQHRLKNLFQEWDVPPWLRDRIPLLYAGKELIAVVGFAIAEFALAGEDEMGYLITSLRGTERRSNPE